MASISYRVSNTNVNDNDSLTGNVGDTITVSGLSQTSVAYGLKGNVSVPGCSYAVIKWDAYSMTGTITTPGTYYLVKRKGSSYGGSDGGTLTLTIIGNVNYYSNLYYNANGGTGAPSNNLDTKSAQTTPSARSITIPSTIPTREHYTFKGWSKTSTGSVEYVSGNTISVPYLTTNTGITLYAVWEEAPKTKYYSKLSYNVVGGSPGIDDDSDIKEDYTTPTTRTTTITNTEPSKERYEFLGWSETKGSLSPEYKKGDSISVPYLDTDTGIVLFALYKKTTTVKACFYMGGHKIGVRNMDKKITIHS